MVSSKKVFNETGLAMARDTRLKVERGPRPRNWSKGH